jgi:hypothetical protein
MGRWVFAGLLAIAIAVGVAAWFGNGDWGDHRPNHSEVVTTTDGHTIVIEHDRHFFPGFIFIPFLFFGLFWLFGPWRWRGRGDGGRGGGPGQVQYAEWERWLDDWHRRQHDQLTTNG